MKKKKELIVFLISFFLINNLFSQNSDSCNVEISGSVYFDYFRYPIKINIKDTSNILIESDKNSIIYNYHDGRYKIAFHGNERKSTVKVYKMKDSIKYLLCSKEFTFQKLPVTAGISNKYFSGNGVKIDELINLGIGAYIINYGIEVSFKVKSFTLTLVKNNEVIDLNAEGNRFTEKQIESLKELDYKSPVIIRNIMIERNKDDFEMIAPIVLFIIKGD